MTLFGKTLAAVLSCAPIAASAATLGGVDYATQYDYREFYTAADGKNFRVVLQGNPFPSTPADDVGRRLLQQMQANKPQPRLTFTYDKPAVEQRPDYRVVFVFDPAGDLGADSVCKGGDRHQAATAGRVYVFAIYCRNDLALSQVTGRTAAGGPDDPLVGQLFKDVFATLFNSSPGLRPHLGGSFR